jgi:hypothetical protein
MISNQSPILYTVPEISKFPSPQFTASGEEKALLAELARIIPELHQHGPDMVTVEEFGQADSSPVTNPLPLAVEEHPVPHLRQGGNSIRVYLRHTSPAGPVCR